MVLLAGCAALPDLEPDTCGNAVVEGGEDCDTFAALGSNLTCGPECRYVCDPDVRPPACPNTGWSCGQDGICRFASGMFREAPDSPFVFAGDTLLLGDLDADEAQDVVGGTVGAVEVRFGEAQGSFRTSFSIATDLPTSQRSLARVDDGPELDVLSPNPEGLDVFYGDEARILIPAGFAPHAEATLAVDAADDARVAPMPTGNPTDTLLAVAVAGGQLWVRRAPDADRAGSVAVSLGSADGTRLAGRLVPHPLRAEDGRWAAAVAVEGSRRVLVVGFDQSREPQVLATVTTGALGTVSEGARLADLDRDRIADLMVGVALPNDGRAVLVAKGRGDGAFEALRLFIPLERRCLPGEDCLRWPLAMGDVDQDGALELAFPEGLFSLTASVAAPTQIFDQRIDPWGAVSMVDLNGDGRLDVAAASATRGVLQVLINAGVGRFNVVPLDAGRTIRALRTGDFDGDGVGDLALVQDLGTAESEISVVFGTRSGPPSSPALMGRFEHITDVEPGLLPSRALPNADGITDLVVRVDNGARRSFALMTGTGQRRLHAPLALPVNDRRALDLATVPAAALGVDLRGRGEADLAVFTFGGRLIMLPKTPGGALLETASILAVNPDCASESILGNGCLQVAAERRPSGREAVVVVNRRPDCPAEVKRPALSLTRLELAEDGMMACTPYLLDGLDALGGPGAPRVADLDANQQMDLLVAFTGREDGAAGVAVWREEAARPTVVSPPDGVVIFAATDIGADRDPARELAVLSEDGIRILDQVDGGYAWVDAPVISLSVDPNEANAHLAAADVDGDGLDDLLVSTAGRLSVYLADESWLGGPRPE